MGAIGPALQKLPQKIQPYMPLIGAGMALYGALQQRRALEQVMRQQERALAELPTPAEAAWYDPEMYKRMQRELMQAAREAYAARGLAGAGLAVRGELEALQRLQQETMARALERKLAVGQARAAQLREIADVYAQRAAAIGQAAQQMAQQLMQIYLMRQEDPKLTTPTPTPETPVTPLMPPKGAQQAWRLTR